MQHRDWVEIGKSIAAFFPALAVYGWKWIVGFVLGDLLTVAVAFNHEPSPWLHAICIFGGVIGASFSAFHHFRLAKDAAIEAATRAGDTVIKERDALQARLDER